MNGDVPGSAEAGAETGAETGAVVDADPGADTGAGERAGSAAGAPRQAIVRQPGRSRRAKLMPAPDTDPNPHPPVLREEGGVAPTSGDARGARGARSENDARLRQDRPPHW